MNDAAEVLPAVLESLADAPGGKALVDLVFSTALQVGLQPVALLHRHMQSLSIALFRACSPGLGRRGSEGALMDTASSTALHAGLCPVIFLHRAPYVTCLESTASCS